MPGAVLVHFSPRSGGGEQRLQTWERLFAAVGVPVTRVPVLTAPPWRAPGVAGHGLAVVGGRLTVESLAWSRTRVSRSLARVRPDAIVFVTLRAFDPKLVGSAGLVVLDHVDLLSESYRQRALVTDEWTTRWAFRLLSRATGRVERRVAADPFVRVAAGLADARALGAEWLPVLPQLPAGPARPRRQASSADLLFTGTLDYAPNVAALRAWRQAIWPLLARRAPGARLVVGGRRPTPEVRRIVADVGGVLVEDFDRFEDVAAGAAMAVVPLTVATGMQNKLLDAASVGLPIVATPDAMRGVDPEFPAAVASLGPAFVERVVGLLQDPGRASALGVAAMEHVRSAYSVRRWADVVRRWIPDDADAGGDRSGGT